jgi:hypothetical protein
MVIDFGLKNRSVALWKSLSEASIQKAQNEPSTQLIEATSCVERLNATIKAKANNGQKLAKLPSCNEAR